MDRTTVRFGIVVVAVVLVLMTWSISSCQVKTDVARLKYYEDKKKMDEEWYDSRGYKKVSLMRGHKWVKGDEVKNETD